MENKEFDFLQPFSSLECWDYTVELELLQGQKDLQLAAELGKTLLERNKELETKLKHYQNVVEDRNQEIGYLTKQAAALREVNDSRLRIYEQLEVSIQELERANHRLLFESASDKKQIKNLTASIEALEQKCEELQGKIEDLNLQADMHRRKTAKPPDDGPCPNCRDRQILEYSQMSEDETDFVDKSTNGSRNQQNDGDVSRKKAEEDESIELIIANEVVQLTAQLRECKILYEKEQMRGVDLEEQLASMVKQHQVLEKQVTQLSLRDDQSKSMHEELSSLDEFRGQGLCCRCLRTIGSSRASETMSFLDDEPEDDDDDLSILNALNENSNIQQHCSTFNMDIQDKSEPLDDTDIIRIREISLLWIWPGSTLITLLIDILMYISDRIIYPLLSKPWRIPLILLNCLLRPNKLHQL